MKTTTLLCSFLFLLLTSEKVQLPNSGSADLTNYITITNLQFGTARIHLLPDRVGSTNLYFDNGKTHYTDVRLLGTYDDRTIEFEIKVPGQAGTYAINNDQASVNNTVSLMIGNKYQMDDGGVYKPKNVTVVLTHFDVPGGTIGGTIAGVLTKQDGSDPLNVSAEFSVPRGK